MDNWLFNNDVSTTGVISGDSYHGQKTCKDCEESGHGLLSRNSPGGSEVDHGKSHSG